MKSHRSPLGPPPPPVSPALIRRTPRKAYQKPTLVEAAVLSTIAATDSGSISGIPNDTDTCWIARAAFGEADIRWMIFRAWLLEDAPAWFRSLYIRYGEVIGAWLAGRDSARRVVRALMMPAVNRKLWGWTSRRKFLQTPDACCAIALIRSNANMP